MEKAVMENINCRTGSSQICSQQLNGETQAGAQRDASDKQIDASEMMAPPASMHVLPISHMSQQKTSKNKKDSHTSGFMCEEN